jgi:putative membrane protein
MHDKGAVLFVSKNVLKGRRNFILHKRLLPAILQCRSIRGGFFMIAEQNRALTMSLVGLFVLIMTGLSVVNAYDHTTWLMEVAPVLIGLPILVATYRRFPLTTLIYALICAHALILIVGGHYSYARVPLGFWMQDFFALDRNPYDKIGHFAQGFIPVMIAREILVRGAYVHGRKMLAFLCLCVVMAISAWYELIEWVAALCLGQGADEFLGTQGYQWDTQADMFFAMIGGIAALALLSRWHDRQLSRVA